MRPLFALLTGLLLATSAHALSLADISGKDAGGGLKEALTQGAARPSTCSASRTASSATPR
jgi:hypothetical protein